MKEVAYVMESLNHMRLHFDHVMRVPGLYYEGSRTGIGGCRFSVIEQIGHSLNDVKKRLQFECELHIAAATMRLEVTTCAT
jgi:hypothetical protein